MNKKISQEHIQTIGYYETLWLNTFEECEIILCRQYVDDTIYLFNCESDAANFFEFLNATHSNIKFTFKSNLPNFHVTSTQISFSGVL